MGSSIVYITLVKCPQKPSTWLAWAAVVLVGWGGTACQPKPPEIVLKRPDGTVLVRPPPGSEAEAASQAAEAERLERAGYGEEAQKKRDDIVQRHATTEAAADIFAARGAAADRAGQVAVALDAYKKLLFYHPNHDGADAVRYRYGTLLLQAGQVQDALAFLEAFYKQSSGDDRVAALYVEALTRADEVSKAIVVLAARREAARDVNAKRQLTDEIIGLVKRGLDFADAVTLWRDVHEDDDWAFLHPALAFKLAKIYVHTRQFGRAEEMLHLVLERFSGSPFAAQARKTLTHLRARFTVDGKAVGVLLPLSGRYRQYGERSLAAVQLAFKEHPDVRLVVRDTGGSAQDASAAVEELVLKEHVIAIIGPLFSASAYAAGIKAEEFSVPIVLLSHREGLPGVGSYVFRTALTVEAQARGLAAVAFDKLGMRRFALLYPRNHYGEAFVDAFWQEVEARRGEIRGIESYEHDETTYRDQVRKLVGRYFLYARADYREALQALEKRDLTPLRRQHALEEVQSGLPPVVDFDAIVIPDTGRNFPLIAPALAFEDIVLTRDPKILERMQKATGREELNPVTLLGGSTWNNSQAVESCERYCEDAVFVDAFFADSPRTQVRDFVATFTDKVGAAPRLSEAQAFDTAQLVSKILAKVAPTLSRDAFREALAAVRFRGVTGEMVFDSNGEANKRLLTLTIQRRRIIELDKPEG